LPRLLRSFHSLRGTRLQRAPCKGVRGPKENTMASLKDRVENHPAVFFLAAIVAGFLAGIGTYQAVLSMSGQETISVAQHQLLKSKLASLEDDNKALTSTVSNLKAKQRDQHWLRVKGIEGLDGLRARIIARVNGNAISYPSRAVFSHVGLGMPAEDFALPTSDEYRISFEILGVGGDQEFSQFQSQQVVHVKQVPFEGEYRIFAITKDEWGTTRGIPSPSGRTERIEGRIQFEVR